MYRVSREGRRNSGNDPDTPPRPHKQRFTGGASPYHSAHFSAGSSRLFFGSPRIRLGLKVAAVVTGLLFLRRVRKVVALGSIGWLVPFALCRDATCLCWLDGRAAYMVYVVLKLSSRRRAHMPAAPWCNS